METLSAIEMAMRLVGGKHKCLILHYLSGGTKRPRDLLRLLPGISQKMLAEQLRQLVADGLVLREAFAEVPPRVEYRLSAEGWTIIPLLRDLCVWGKEYATRAGGGGVYRRFCRPMNAVAAALPCRSRRYLAQSALHLLNERSTHEENAINPRLGYGAYPLTDFGAARKR